MKERREKVLYICGIDWEWIFQRPQIIAERLAKDYDVTVVFPRSIVQFCKHKSSTDGMEKRILWTLPFQEKNRFIGALAEWFQKKLFRDYQEYQYIYVGYPMYGRYIPQDYRGKIIYDCMDNHEALYPDRKRVGRIVEEEKKLVSRCDELIVSSTVLEKKMNAMKGESVSVLVRNGAQIPQTRTVKEPCVKGNYTLAYVGTIAEWFDWELLRHSTGQNPKLMYHLLGPGGDKVTESDRAICWRGIVPHEKLWDELQDVDCLLMPFLLNDIILSVDPVKLYEYIAFGKCIVSVYYPELDHFSDYVYFYHNREEYDELMEELCEKGFPPKYDSKMQTEFVANNSWEARYLEIRKLMQQRDGD